MYRKHKTKATDTYQQIIFQKFFLETNLEEELVSEIGNEFQIVGAR